MRWIPLLRIGAVLTAVTLAATACGEQQPPGGGNQPPGAEGAQFEPGTTMARLSQAGQITVGTKFDQPLFGLRGLDGKPQGFDVEIAKIIAGQLGIAPENIRWVETPSAVREEVIQQGRVDMVVATYTINDQRRQRVSFAGPYYVAGQDLMVTANNTQITGPEALRPTRARVCSVQGSTPAEQILAYIDPAQLTLFDVYSKCADALRTGQVDVVTTDNVILLGLVEQSRGAFKLVGRQFTEEPYGIGIRKGDVAFCEFINQTLQRAAENGSYQRAWESTAGRVAPQTPTLPRLDPCT